MTKDHKPNQSQSGKRTFFLTGWGIAILTFLTCGLALPFLLWARGPQTKERGRRIVLWSVAVVVLALIGNAISPPASDETTKKASNTPTTELSSEENKSGSSASSASMEPPDIDWTELGDSEIDPDSIEFWPKDKYMISARIRNTSGVETHYRIKLDIEVEGGASRRAPFCTTTPAKSKSGYQVVNLKVFRGDDGGESWAGLLDIVTGSFRFSYSVVSAEKSSLWCGAH